MGDLFFEEAESESEGRRQQMVQQSTTTDVLMQDRAAAPNKSDNANLFLLAPTNWRPWFFYFCPHRLLPRAVPDDPDLNQPSVASLWPLASVTLKESNNVRTIFDLSALLLGCRQRLPVAWT
jgi:hypothetical protein